MWWGSYSSRRGRRSRWQTSTNHVSLDTDEETKITSDMSEPEIEQRIRRRVEIRRQQRREFFGHLTSYVIVNMILWFIFATTSSITWINGIHVDFPWPLFVSFFWGIGLVSHGIQVYQNSPRVMARRESAMRNEIEMEKARMGYDSSIGYEKPKRDRAMRLSDDGELVPIDEDESAATDQVNKAKRDQLL